MNIGEQLHAQLKKLTLQFKMLHLLTMPVVLRKFAGYVDTEKKAVIDRTLRPLVLPLNPTAKSRHMRPLPATGRLLLRTVYSQAQGCVCTALQLGGDVQQPWLVSKYDVIHKTGST